MSGHRARLHARGGRGPGALVRAVLAALAAALFVGLPSTASAATPEPAVAVVAAVSAAAAAEPVVVAAGRLPAPDVPPIPGTDCKGDPPKPGSPYAHLSVKPVLTATGDPFAAGGPSIESVYGTTYRWWSYDNGCGAGSGILPGMGARLGNFVQEISGVVPNWGHYLMDVVVDPTPWIGALDPVVTRATQAVAQSVWTPWLIVALTGVAIIVLWRARTGMMAGSVTAAVWAVLVLVFCTWSISYPAEAVSVVDQGVQGAVVGIATGFADTDTTPADGVHLPPAPGRTDPATPWTTPGQDTRNRDAALVATDRLYDTLIRETMYRSWLTGVFGNPDSPTAKTYGPDVFKATHFSFAEYDGYQKDPEGAGKQLLQTKADAFTQLAAKIHDADPIAYNHFTGNEWDSTLATATFNLVVVLSAALFLLVAALCVLIAYVIVRLGVPISPALGVLALMDVFRSHTMALLRRAAAPVVMGPVFLVVGLVVLRFNAAVAEAQNLNSVLKLALILIVSVLAWKLLKPMDIVVPTISVPGLDSLKRYVVWRKGAHDGTSSALAEESDAARPGDAPSRGLVHRDLPNPGMQALHVIHHATGVAGDSGGRVWDQGSAPALSASPWSSPDLAAPMVLAGSPAVPSTFAADAPHPSRIVHAADVDGRRLDVRSPGPATLGSAPTSAGTAGMPTQPDVVTYRGPRPDPLDLPDTASGGVPAWKVTGDRPTRTVHRTVDEDTPVARRLYPVTVSDTNVTYDEGGREVYVVYHPGGNLVLRRDDHPTTNDAARDGLDGGDEQ